MFTTGSNCDKSLMFLCPSFKIDSQLSSYVIVHIKNDVMRIAERMWFAKK